MTAQEQAGSEETPEPTEPADQFVLPANYTAEDLAALEQWFADRRARRTPNVPAKYALGDAPDPAEFPDPAKKPRKTGTATHTGTDPHGRAIGPAEDHTKAKRDRDGLTAKEAAEKAAREQKETQA